MPLEEGEETARSVEVPRRVLVGEEQGRLSRGSLGSIRGSDKFGTLEESRIDDSHGNVGNDQQWQDVEDDMGNIIGARDSM